MNKRSVCRSATLVAGACILVTLAVQCGGAPQPSATATPPSSSPPSGTTAVRYSSDVQPIFNQYCVSCHGRSGGLGLASYQQVMAGGRSGTAVVPGDPQGSLLVLRITGAVQPRMPLGGPALPAVDIQAIEDWVAEGAPDN